MPSVNLRELRDTRQLVSWLEAGEVVELRKRNRIVGRIVPESPTTTPVVWPDAAARRRAIFGGRQVDVVKTIIEDRDSRGF
jgi:antitoxin (DNA-binding transcriptional repressor) of toxin-antitoxin stability system